MSTAAVAEKSTTSTPQSAALAGASHRPEPKPLKPEQIQFLVFEGGGGKGFAYLGAIQVLERLKVMDHIQGFAGASAGAITALLLSLGMTSKEIEAYMRGTDFTKFFDPATPRKRPAPYTQIEVKDTEAERRFVAGKPQVDFADLLSDLARDDDQSILESVLMSLRDIAQIVGSGWLLILTTVIDMLTAHVIEKYGNSLDAPIPQLLRDWKAYLAYLPRDMGFFSGEAARNEFAQLISERARKRQRTGGLRLSPMYEYKHLTFKQHFEIFKKNLLVTGTNLRSGKTQLFSRKHTPNFPVADAIRISMGLPWIYKPYIIDQQQDGWPSCGLYVDGGVWNNLPFREFEAEGSEDQTTHSAAQRQRARGRKTLALRLEMVPAANIQSVFGLTAQMLQYGIFGSGESQVLDSYSDQMVLLDIRGLSLTNFRPPEEKRVRAIKRARRTTMRYFGLGDFILDDDRDDADDLETARLLKESETCK